MLPIRTLTDSVQRASLHLIDPAPDRRDEATLEGAVGTLDGHGTHRSWTLRRLALTADDALAVDDEDLKILAREAGHLDADEQLVLRHEAVERGHPTAWPWRECDSLGELLQALHFLQSVPKRIHARWEGHVRMHPQLGGGSTEDLLVDVVDLVQRSLEFLHRSSSRSWLRRSGGP